MIKKERGSVDKNKKAQIWVETVVYTLIAFVMIGLVLTFIKPKIEEMQDKAIIDQSLEIIKSIDKIITEIGIPGNKREIEIGIKKGVLKIDGTNDKIVFEIESKYEYSEVGSLVTDPTSGIEIRTENEGRIHTISLTKKYSPDSNITFNGKQEIKELTKASIPYKVFITNNGGSPRIIDFEVV